MLSWNLISDRQTGLPRVHGYSGNAIAILLSIVATTGVATGWIMCRAIGARLLFGLPLAVFGAIASVVMLDQILVVSSLFGTLRADTKLLIDLVSTATVGSAVVVLPLWFFSSLRKRD